MEMEFSLKRCMLCTSSCIALSSQTADAVDSALRADAVDSARRAEDAAVPQRSRSAVLTFLGSSCFAAGTFMLSIDQKIVNDHITSFMFALCLLFGSYYCFNIHYPVELRSTLEFLQSRKRDTGSAEHSRQRKAESLATPFGETDNPFTWTFDLFVVQV
ncbi:hypothetical protein N1851_012526 [Merluccius polli]|uniref:Transmembrane protein n=1 Tax=Merluccius polli TaxID=89951 RepID=A0AA47P493_MERPO|nr:hypothetical protein N1851_012526 [Merluccius polli]